MKCYIAKLAGAVYGHPFHSFSCTRCALTEVHAVLVVALQQTQQQMPQMARSLSGDAANSAQTQEQSLTALKLNK